MDIVTVYFALIAVALVVAIGAVVLAHRKGVIFWAVAVLLCFALGGVWQEIALRTFAAREAEGMSGLILRPTPLGGGDHELAPRGAHYAKFSFIIPGIAALAAAFFVSLLAVAVRETTAGPVVLAGIAGALAYVLLAISRLLAASEIFI